MILSPKLLHSFSCVNLLDFLCKTRPLPMETAWLPLPVSRPGQDLQGGEQRRPGPPLPPSRGASACTPRLMLAAGLSCRDWRMLGNFPSAAALPVVCPERCCIPSSAFLCEEDLGAPPFVPCVPGISPTWSGEEPLTVRPGCAEAGGGCLYPYSSGMLVGCFPSVFLAASGAALPTGWGSGL